MQEQRRPRSWSSHKGPIRVRSGSHAADHPHVGCQPCPSESPSNSRKYLAAQTRAQSTISELRTKSAESRGPENSDPNGEREQRNGRLRSGGVLRKRRRTARIRRASTQKRPFGGGSLAEGEKPGSNILRFLKQIRHFARCRLRSRARERPSTADIVVKKPVEQARREEVWNVHVLWAAHARVRESVGEQRLEV